MSDDNQGDNGVQWRWSYNRWIGVMYGPIPVGIIVVGVGAGVYFAFFQ